MKIFEYPKCSTCRAAKKFINNNNIKASFYDITKEPPTTEEIKSILNTFKIDIKKLFNTSGMKYRELNLKDKLPHIDLDEKIKILISDGMLIKRPLAFDLANEILLIGFKEVKWEEQLL